MTSVILFTHLTVATSCAHTNFNKVLMKIQFTLFQVLEEIEESCGELLEKLGFSKVLKNNKTAL